MEPSPRARPGMGEEEGPRIQEQAPGMEPSPPPLLRAARGVDRRGRAAAVRGRAVADGSGSWATFNLFGPWSAWPRPWGARTATCTAPDMARVLAVPGAAGPTPVRARRWASGGLGGAQSSRNIRTCLPPPPPAAPRLHTHTSPLSPAPAAGLPRTLLKPLFAGDDLAAAGAASAQEALAAGNPVAR